MKIYKYKMKCRIDAKEENIHCKESFVKTFDVSILFTPET